MHAVTDVSGLDNGGSSTALGEGKAEQRTSACLQQLGGLLTY